DNPNQFGARLGGRLEAAKPRLDEDLGGFDNRRLLKIVLCAGEPLPDLSGLPGIELVSEENRTILLAFASDEGLATFESRLATLARDGTVTRQQLLYAIDDFDGWTPEDRTGNALRQNGFPSTEPFILDVELWPQERPDRRGMMIESFRAWLDESRIEFLDSLCQPSLVMVRVRCLRTQAERLLLHHRDVRGVDLPPRLGIEVGVLQTDI